MDQKLFKQENDLLASLSQWETEASRSRLALEQAEAQLSSVKSDLNDVRGKILREFLSERFDPLYLAYTLRFDATTGEIFLSVVSTPGGELEYDKFVNNLGWADLSNIPLEYVLRYFGEGLPWGTGGAVAYV